MSEEVLPMTHGQRVAAAFFCIVGIIGAFGCSGVRPGNLGVRDGRLAPCPSSPNCVSSQSPDKEHEIEPLTYTGNMVVAHDELKKMLLGMKRVEIITDTRSYIHAEFTSAVWRFVDDAEFYFDENSQTIHIRSASRLGKSDFGVNRKRVESIRDLWKEMKERQP
jgi:uncharacterized protein (DUF1499 family)